MWIKNENALYFCFVLKQQASNKNKAQKIKHKFYNILSLLRKILQICESIK